MFTVVMVATLLAQAPLPPEVSPVPEAEAQIHDGPFGLWAGMAKTEIERLGPLDKMSGRPSAWATSTVPRSDARFNRYYLTVGPTAGLCQIVAFTPPGAADSFGDTTRSSFNAIEALISGIYGKAERIDRLKPGSIWSKPREWMMGLLKGERILAATWEAPAATMRNRLTKIVLTANARSSDSGFLALGYTFDTMPACEADDSATASKVF